MCSKISGPAGVTPDPGQLPTRARSPKASGPATVLSPRRRPRGRPRARLGASGATWLDPRRRAALAVPAHPLVCLSGSPWSGAAASGQEASSPVVEAVEYAERRALPDVGCGIGACALGRDCVENPHDFGFCRPRRKRFVLLRTSNRQRRGPLLIHDYFYTRDAKGKHLPLSRSAIARLWSFDGVRAFDPHAEWWA